MCDWLIGVCVDPQDLYLLFNYWVSLLFTLRHDAGRWLCGRNARSSAKSRPFNCHQIPCLFWFMTHLMIQSIAEGNRQGDSKHSCLTPVFTSNISVNCPSSSTLQLIEFVTRVPNQVDELHRYTMMSPYLRCQMPFCSRQN